MKPLNKAKEHGIALAVYTLLCLIFFKEIFVQTQWFSEDFFMQNFPNRFLAAVEIRNGSLPLWNPFVFSGMPFLADIQTAVLYPFNLLMSLFVADSRLSFALYEYQVALHFIPAGYFMYLYLRELEMEFFSALLGGMLFAFGGYFINHAHHANMIHSGIWLPAIFYCCLRGFKNDASWFWACPILMTVSLLGGHPQIAIFICYVFAAYYFYLAWESRECIKLQTSAFRFAVIVIAFLLLSMVQIIPTAEFLQNTSRSAMDFPGATQDSLPPHGLWTVLFSNMFTFTYEAWEQWEFRVYLGSGAILLAFLGLSGRTLPRTRFFWALAVLSLVLALGGNTPLYKLFYTLVPGFKFFRVPARFLYLFLFSVSVLAAHGLHFFLRAEERDRALKQLLLVSSIFLTAIPACAVLFSKLPLQQLEPHVSAYSLSMLSLTVLLFVSAKRADMQHWTKAAIFIVIAADLFFFRGLFNHIHLDKESMYKAIYQTPLATVLQNKKDGTRFLAKNAYALYANMGSVYRMSNISGYNPFELKLYAKLNPTSPQIANLLGTRFIDFHDSEALANTWKDQAVFKVQDLFMVNDKALPRAFFVDQARFDPNFDLQKNLESGEFDPLKTIYLDTEFPATAPSDKPPVYNVARYEIKANEVIVSIQNNSKGFLFVSEVYYPGWMVYVNGEKKAVLRANSAFRAVHLDAGINNVRFAFQPLSFRIGAGISVATFLAMACLFARSISKKRLRL